MNEQELFWAGRRHRIISLNRHELIQSEWWQGLSERHYFRVITDTAYDLWIFKSQEQFFLHGFFD